VFLAIVSKLGRFGSQRRHADRQTPTTDERDRDDIRANGRPVERLPERHPLVHSSGSGCSEVPSESTISPVAPRAKNAVFMANYTTIFVNQFVSCVCVCVCVCVVATTVTLLLQDNVAYEEERPR